MLFFLVRQKLPICGEKLMLWWEAFIINIQSKKLNIYGKWNKFSGVIKCSLLHHKIHQTRQSLSSSFSEENLTIHWAHVLNMNERTNEQNKNNFFFRIE